MLEQLGWPTLDALIDAAVPKSIRLDKPLRIPAALSEAEALAEIRQLASQNQVFRSFIGMGYYDCITPPVIQRNVLENPGWYTQYTPYQAEISQGRLEALLNFQTIVSDLTAMDIANASLLRPQLRLLGHLVTRCDPRLLVHRSYEQKLRSLYRDAVLATVVLEASAFKVSLSCRQPVSKSVISR